MEKLDLSKTYKTLYTAPAKTVQLIDVPSLKFLMIDGRIEPGLEPGNSPSFQEATAALYGIAYTLKFMLKKREDKPIDYPVMALEGLWWVEDGRFDIKIKDNWFWTLMIMVPDFIDNSLFHEAMARLKKKSDPAALSGLRLDSCHEGLCVQILHIGPYADEPATVERLETFARDRQLQFHHKHHEIYLGDPRRSRPEKLKTILRHPVSKI